METTTTHTKGETMNNAALEGFRQIADAMIGSERNWEWHGLHLSQHMVGITQERAEEYAAKHGGTASEIKQGSK